MHNIVAIIWESVSCDPKGEGPTSHLRGAETFGLISDWESTSLLRRETRDLQYPDLTFLFSKLLMGLPIEGSQLKTKGYHTCPEGSPRSAGPIISTEGKGWEGWDLQGQTKDSQDRHPFIWKTKPTCYFLVTPQLSCSGLTTHSWSPSIFSIPGVCMVDGACPVHASLPMGLWVLWACTHHLFVYLQHLHQMWEYFCTEKIRSGRNEWGNHLR